MVLLSRVVRRRRQYEHKSINGDQCARERDGKGMEVDVIVARKDENDTSIPFVMSSKVGTLRYMAPEVALNVSTLHRECRCIFVRDCFVRIIINISQIIIQWLDTLTAKTNMTCILLIIMCTYIQIF